MGLGASPPAGASGPGAESDRRLQAQAGNVLNSGRRGGRQTLLREQPAISLHRIHCGTR